MRSFSQIVAESRDLDSIKLLQKDITGYINALKKSLPVDVQKAIYITSKYNLNSAADVDAVRTANKSKLKALADEYNMPQDEMEDLWSLLKSIKQNYRVMPQYLSATEREMIEKGQMALSDATIDLETKAGREAAAKLYTPLVLTIVNSLIGKSSLDRASLISAGNLGLLNAINDWKREPDDKTKKVIPFKTYAGARIRQQILNDMDKYSHSLSGTNWYATKKMRDGENGTLDAVSFDNLEKIDNLDALGTVDRDINDDPLWKKLYADLERKFTQRDTDIFYRFFGVNGRKKEKSKDIAKSYGMSEGNIQNSIIKKIIKYIKNNRQLTDILMDIMNIYTESLMKDMFGMSREQIIETLASNDIYLLLEDVTRWENKAQFNRTYQYALSVLNDTEKKVIARAMTGGFAEVDANLRAQQSIYVKFLRAIAPTANAKWTDGDIIDNMVNVASYVNKHKL